MNNPQLYAQLQAILDTISNDSTEQGIDALSELMQAVTPKPQKVKLTYFKPSGKYYSEGSYRTNSAHEFGVAKEIREFRHNRNLPGLSNGDDFTILVNFGKGILCVPMLLKPEIPNASHT